MYGPNSIISSECDQHLYSNTRGAWIPFMRSTVINGTMLTKLWCNHLLCIYDEMMSWTKIKVGGIYPNVIS